LKFSVYLTRNFGGMKGLDRRRAYHKSLCFLYEAAYTSSYTQSAEINMDKTEVSEPSQPALPQSWLNPGVIQLVLEQEQSVPEVAPPTPEPEIMLSLPALPPPPPVPTKPRHVWVRLTALGSALLLVLLLSGGLYLRNHSLAPVHIASLKPTHNVNDPRLATELTTAAASYRLGLQTPDGKVTTYSLAEMGLKPDVAGTLAAAKGQHGLAFWHTVQVPLKLTTDKSSYVAFLRSHTAQASVPPTDANVSIAGGKVTIVSEKDGRGNRVANASTTVAATAAKLDTTPLVLTPGSIGTFIKAAGLQSDKAALERILNQHISLKIGDDTVTPSASDIASWLTLTPDYSKGTIAIAVNQIAVQQYIERVAEPYTDAPADTVTPTGINGSVSIVEQSGHGTITNETTAVSSLSSGLLSAKGQAVSLAVSGSAPRTVKATAQPKWLLVNVTTKRMYAYEDTKLVKSFLISAGAAATPTVQGTYKIYAKYASQDMRGANADGTDYFQPNVQYVNYFYKDYAVHGNYWRPVSYFGNVNSSHGCVGIVNSDAAWVYSWAPVGTTVMVHG